MVTEKIIQDIVKLMYGKSCITTQTLYPDSENPKVHSRKHENAIGKNDLYNELMLSYDVGEIRNAVLWLDYRGFIGVFGYGRMAPEMGYNLTEKGVKYATSIKLEKEDKIRLSTKAFTINPGIYGIKLNPKEIWWRIKQRFKKIA